jgi:hypothetical protein
MLIRGDFIIKKYQIAFAFIATLALHSAVNAATLYEVGPGKTYSAIGLVPWESLQAGDTVLIYWRSTPYQEKWVICRQGTQTNPITVRGVAGPNGELPVLDGNGATTRSTLNYWNQDRGVIKIGGASTPTDTLPKYITIENLDIRSARPPFTFKAANGSALSYAANASAIYVEKGENIVVRNCIMHDCGNGFFVASSAALSSKNILVEGNYIYDNGNVGSIYEHNNYTAAIGITFQYNRFGPLRAGCSGNNLKDRSAGLVVRYNWIESGNRQLDLVDAEDSALILNDPSYRQTFVYGNLLIEPDGAGNRQIVHYGGDSGTTSDYRKGTLFFYNNTLVSTRTDRTTLFRLSTNEETCDMRNNIAYVSAAGSTLSFVDGSGVLNLSHNWFKPGFVNTFGTLTGTINNDGTSVVGSSPSFINEAAQNFNITAASSCINAGTALHSSVLSPNHVTRQYVKHQAGQARANSGALDIGAYEVSSLPKVTIALPLTGSYVTNSTIAVAGAAFDDNGIASVTVNGFTAQTVNAYTNWNVIVNNLIKGTNILSATATNTVAQSTNATIGIIYTTKPDEIWKVTYFGGRFFDDPDSQWTSDPDGDGLSNQEEYASATDPTNSVSRFYVVSSYFTNTTQYCINWQSVVGKIYRIETSTNLTTWLAVTNLQSTSFISSWIDNGTIVQPSPSSRPRSFYRIRGL